MTYMVLELLRCWPGMPLNSSAGSRRTGCAWPARAPGMGPSELGYHCRVLARVGVSGTEVHPLGSGQARVKAGTAAQGTGSLGAHCSLE